MASFLYPISFIRLNDVFNKIVKVGICYDKNVFNISCVVYLVFSCVYMYLIIFICFIQWYVHVVPNEKCDFFCHLMPNTIHFENAIYIFLFVLSAKRALNNTRISVFHLKDKATKDKFIIAVAICQFHKLSK